MRDLHREIRLRTFDRLLHLAPREWSPIVASKVAVRDG
jgi:hypothetical protein